MTPRFKSYFEEVMFERLIPGAGELALHELLAVLLKDRIISLEIPMREQTLAGKDPKTRLQPSVEAAHRLLSEVNRNHHDE